MTTPISQVKYWLDESSGANNVDIEGADVGTYLSYDVFLGLSVLGGFFGLDHLYLRSPFTFVAKLIVNMLCFGVWWLYDAVQAVFHADVVKVYGLGIPGWGPMGIGAGVLSKDVPDKKHFRFLMYSFALFFGGMIGMDSFLVGDKQIGFFRLIGTLSFIFLPLSGAYWAYQIYQYAVNTEEVINDHYEFFGAPYHSLANRMRSRFPLLGWLFSPIETLKSIVNNFIGPALIEPITTTAQSAINTVDRAVSTVDNTVQLGRNVISKSSEIVEQVGKTLDTLSQASTLMPAASLYASAQQGLKGATQQGGGMNGGSSKIEPSNLNTIGYVLLATFSLVVLTGFVTTIYRAYNEQRISPLSSKQHQQQQRDDAPPEPTQSTSPTKSTNPTSPTKSTSSTKSHDASSKSGVL